MARVVIEQAQLGGFRWGVFIERDAVLHRTLWDRYPSQEAAEAGFAEARAYLEARGEADNSAPSIRAKRR